EAYELFGERRVVALLPRDVVRLKTVHYYHEQTKKDWDGLWHRDPGEVHVRIALEDDDCLEIVPGSGSPQPIALQAGDACVFDAATLHRATYRREPIRRTIDAVYLRR